MLRVAHKQVLGRNIQLDRIQWQGCGFQMLQITYKWEAASQMLYIAYNTIGRRCLPNAADSVQMQGFEGWGGNVNINKNKQINIYIYGKCLGFARTRNDDRRRIIIIIITIIRIKSLLKIFNECRSLTVVGELNPY